MPEHLTWFKWESYSTWLSGAALLMIVYWAGGELYLIDASKTDLSLFQGILISAGSLAFGWIVYDQLCKSPLGETPTLLLVLLFVLLVVMGWGYNQVFTGRATFCIWVRLRRQSCRQTFFIIIPTKNRCRGFDCRPRTRSKIRENRQVTFDPQQLLTLPSSSSCCPITIRLHLRASILDHRGIGFPNGVTIRHYFNSLHARRETNLDMARDHYFVHSDYVAVYRTTTS